MEELKEERRLKKFKDVGDAVDHPTKLKKDLQTWLYTKDEEKKDRMLSNMWKVN